MKKLLIICGPTATGKTNLAIQLARILDGEILSADSRQVYKGMDIGTGKEIPANFEFRISNLEFKDYGVGYYSDGKIRLWGYDLADPKEQFSVSHYINIGNKIVDDIEERGKIPILVGGSGLYIRGIADGIETSQAPVDLGLRKSLEHKSADELFERLSAIDFKKATSMNSSDKNNPRRLLRAIEIAEAKKINSNDLISMNRFMEIKNKQDILFIGLKAPKEIINKRVEIRVKARVDMGLESEIKNLLNGGLTWYDKSMNTLGYKEWKPYFEGKININDVVERWTLDEKQYIKRQMTWFKKDGRINWFDISKEDYQSEVEKLVKRWQNDNS